jgi:Domain of unknown function (DUF6316)
MQTARVQMMADKRTGEVGAVPMRTDRFFAVNSAWYFATREGASIGPFDNKGDAQRGLTDFIDFVKLAEPRVLTTFYSSLNNV